MCACGEKERMCVSIKGVVTEEVVNEQSDQHAYAKNSVYVQLHIILFTTGQCKYCVVLSELYVEHGGRYCVVLYEWYKVHGGRHVLYCMNCM